MNRKKMKVVNHALSLFTDQGIGRTSIQDIIDRAGISKGTFYNYFASKNECVSAVLEMIRYETTVRRTELQIGKDPADPEVLSEQIAMKVQYNQQYRLSLLFEEIYHSNDKEMKQHMMTYRFLEIEWLASRLIEVYGEQFRKHAFEAAAIFFATQNHLMLLAKLVNQAAPEPRTVAQKTLHYMRPIIECLHDKNTSVIDEQRLQETRRAFAQEEVRHPDLLLALDQFAQDVHFTKPQAELTAALRSELAQQPIRHAVVHALLRPFLDAFSGSDDYNAARDLMPMIWRYLNR